MRKIVIAGLAAALLAAVLAISSGCGSTVAAGSSSLSVDKYNQIQAGMPADQVKAIAGEPARTESRDTGNSMPGMKMNGTRMDYWYYQGSKGWVRVELAAGQVTAKTGY